MRKEETASTGVHCVLRGLRTAGVVVLNCAGSVGYVLAIGKVPTHGAELKFKSGDNRASQLKNLPAPTSRALSAI